MMYLGDIYLSAVQWLSFEIMSFELQNLMPEVINDQKNGILKCILASM